MKSEAKLVTVFEQGMYEMNRRLDQRHALLSELDLVTQRSSRRELALAVTLLVLVSASLALTVWG